MCCYLSVLLVKEAGAVELKSCLLFHRVDALLFGRASPCWSEACSFFMYHCSSLFILVHLWVLYWWLWSMLISFSDFLRLEIMYLTPKNSELSLALYSLTFWTRMYSLTPVVSHVPLSSFVFCTAPTFVFLLYNPSRSSLLSAQDMWPCLDMGSVI